jgi:hypothetical protein
MPIASSIIRIEGTSIIFKTSPVVGLIALTGFTDNATSVMGASFTKTFRYSKDGITFSNWQPLISINITSISLVEKDTLIIEVNYTKVPADSLIDVTSLSFQTTEGTLNTPIEYFSNSLFSSYFDVNDLEALGWCINVLEKIYNKGLIPDYIERTSIEDFLSFWKSVAKFYSFYVKLARIYSKFYNDDSLIREFLTQRGLIVSPENTLMELQELLEKFYFEVAKRGTIRVMDGELLRLIHYKNTIDEYIWCLYRKHHFGWNLGNSSPLYRGLRINDSLNKVPWSLKHVSVADSTPYLNTASIITDGDKQVVAIRGGGSITISVGNAIRVDPRLDYQISFKIKLISGTFGCEAAGYNQGNATVNLKSKKTGSDQNTFFTGAKLSRSDRYLTVKMYLYNKDSGTSALNQNNIRQGQNLVSISTLTKLGLNINCSADANIYDVRFVPMITSYSRGFLQSVNLISLWLRNRNGDYNIPSLKQYIDKYLIPYNCHTKITTIDDYALTVSNSPIETFRWEGAGEYCRQVKWIGTAESCEVAITEWVPDEDTAYCEQINSIS